MTTAVQHNNFCRCDAIQRALTSEHRKGRVPAQGANPQENPTLLTSACSPLLLHLVSTTWSERQDASWSSCSVRQTKPTASYPLQKNVPVGVWRCGRQCGRSSAFGRQFGAHPLPRVDQSIATITAASGRNPGTHFTDPLPTHFCVTTCIARLTFLSDHLSLHPERPLLALLSSGLLLPGFWSYTESSLLQRL